MTPWRFGPHFGLVVLVLEVLGACGPAPRPSGLPPPEYEQPQVEPWSPPSAAPTSAPVTAPAPAPETVVPAPPTAAPPESTGGSGATLPAGTP
jgi:hypothetical protein